MKPPVEAIQALLKNEEDLLNAIPVSPAPADYQQLLNSVILEERRIELKNLQALFFNTQLSDNELLEEFKKRCRAREIENQHTALSFFAMPDGYCNGLYWEIAQILLGSMQLGDTISILLPSIKSIMHVEMRLPSSQTKLNIKALIPLFEFCSITLLTQTEANPNVLMNYVLGDDVLLNLDEVANFPFEVHQSFYCALREQYPVLCEQLYEHNDEFRRLHSDLGLFEEKGRTPFQAITHLIRAFNRGGQSYSGLEDADLSASAAYLLFREYLKMLPADLSQQLLSLKTLRGEQTLHHVCVDLFRLDSSCVETASKNLQSILDNPANASILNQRPALTSQTEQEIKKRYQVSLTSRGSDLTRQLPMHLRQALLSRVVLHSIHDYLDLLINLPEAEYALFLGSATITADPPLPNGLEGAVNMLSRTQANAFFNALWQHPEKFGGIKPILMLAAKTNYLAHWLSLLNRAELLNLTTVRYPSGNTLLHEATPYPELLKALLPLYRDPVQAISVMNDDWNTVFHHAASYPESLKMLLAIYNNDNKADEVPRVLMTKNKIGNTIFHCAIPSPESLEMMLGGLTPLECQTALSQKNNYSETVFHLAAYTPKSLSVILKYYPQASLFDVLIEKGNGGNTVFHVAANFPESLEVIFGFLSLPRCFQAIGQKNNQGYTVLHAAERYASLKMMVDRYPKTVFFLNALREKNVSGRTVLDKMYYDVSSILVIFPHFLTNEKLRDAYIILRQIVTYLTDIEISHAESSSPAFFKEVHDLTEDHDYLLAQDLAVYLLSGKITEDDVAESLDAVLLITTDQKFREIIERAQKNFPKRMGYGPQP